MGVRTSLTGLGAAAVLVIGVGVIGFPGEVDRTAPMRRVAPDDDDTRRVLLFVSYRPRIREVRVWFRAGVEQVRGDTTHISPWRRIVTVRRGESVLVGAYQDTPGTLECTLHELDIVGAETRVASDRRTDVGRVECEG